MAADLVAYRYGIAPAVNRCLLPLSYCFAIVNRGSEKFVPMLELAVAIYNSIASPLAQPAAMSIAADFILRLEFAEMIDVAAEAIHKIEAVIKHAPATPRM